MNGEIVISITWSAVPADLELKPSGVEAPFYCLYDDATTHHPSLRGIFGDVK